MSNQVVSEPLLDHLDSVTALLTPRLGVFCDLDGTLSPIVGDPMAAHATKEARRSLATIRRLGAYVAVVSGRSAAVARAMVGLRGITYVGNHGLEWYEGGRLRRVPALRRPRSVITRLRDLLTPRLSAWGVTVEAKEVGLALHFRRAPDPTSARAALEAILNETPEVGDLVRMEGRQVIELRAEAAETKGTAVRRLAERHGLRNLLYLGDDYTDLSAFAAVRQPCLEGIAGLAIAVVDDETAPEVEAAADYVLAGVPEVERFPAWLAAAL